MGIIIPFALRPSNAARFEPIGGEAHRATMLIFPQVQVRDIRDIWGMTVEGPPHSVPDSVAFSDGKPRQAKASRAKAASAKLPDTKAASVKRKPARHSPE